MRTWLLEASTCSTFTKSINKHCTWTYVEQKHTSEQTMQDTHYACRLVQSHDPTGCSDSLYTLILIQAQLFSLPSTASLLLYVFKVRQYKGCCYLKLCHLLVNPFHVSSALACTFHICHICVVIVIVAAASQSHFLLLQLHISFKILSYTCNLCMVIVFVHCC